MIGFSLGLQVWISDLVLWYVERYIPPVGLAIPHKGICDIDPTKENIEPFHEITSMVNYFFFPATYSQLLMLKVRFDINMHTCFRT